jgi:hypothetical protein
VAGSPGGNPSKVAAKMNGMRFSPERSNPGDDRDTVFPHRHELMFRNLDARPSLA